MLSRIKIIKTNDRPILHANPSTELLFYNIANKYNLATPNRTDITNVVRRDENHNNTLTIQVDLMVMLS